MQHTSLPRLHILCQDKTGERSVSFPGGLFECNQCVLVILSARLSLLFAGLLNLISLVTFFVIKQYYLLLVPLRGSKLALCHNLSPRRSVISLFTLIKLRRR